MIAGCGFVGTGDLNVTYFRNDKYDLGLYYKEEAKTITQLSLERLRELMFVPRKLQLSPIYNQKPRKTLIRNTLKQRIRVNEKATL